MRKSRHLSLTFKELTSTNYSTAMTVTLKKKKKKKKDEIQTGRIYSQKI